MTHLIDLILEFGLGLVFLNVLVEQAGVPAARVSDADRRRAPTWPATRRRSLALLATGVARGGDRRHLSGTSTGRRYGMRVLRTLCRISLSPDSCVTQTESIFVRFGPASMLFAKFVPGFASVATAMAGAVGLRYWKFLLFDALGALLWVGVAIALGQLFREAIVDILETLQSLGKYGLMLVAHRARGVRRVEMVAAPPVHPAAADGPRHGGRAAADDGRRQVGRRSSTCARR